MIRRPLAAGLALALAACGSDENAEQTREQPVAEPTAAPGQLSPAQSALLDERDCRTLAQGYFDAIALREFALAERFWQDPAVDAARLAARFAGYGQPRIAISDVQQEAGAGTLVCTVTGALSDLADPTRPPRQGTVVLSRANDVPGATPEQLRWTIRSSTFIEEMERVGTGDPA